MPLGIALCYISLDWDQKRNPNINIRYHEVGRKGGGGLKVVGCYYSSSLRMSMRIQKEGIFLMKIENCRRCENNQRSENCQISESFACGDIFIVEPNCPIIWFIPLGGTEVQGSSRVDICSKKCCCLKHQCLCQGYDTTDYCRDSSVGYFEAFMGTK